MWQGLAYSLPSDFLSFFLGKCQCFCTVLCCLCVFPPNKSPLPTQKAWLVFTSINCAIMLVCWARTVARSRAVVKFTFVESKTSPRPRLVETMSRPSPKRFKSKSRPSPNERPRQKKRILFKTTHLPVHDLCDERDSILSTLR